MTRDCVARRRALLLLLLGVAAASAGCQALSTSVGGSSTSSLPEPDGVWLVTAHVTTCYDATGADTVRVSGGRFTNAKIFSYSRSGNSETVTITGTITKGNIYLIVQGNEFLTGTACNGGNGFYGFLETTPTSGTVASAWGSLTFVKW